MKNIGRIDEDFLEQVDSAALALGQSRMKFVRLALEARLSQLKGEGLRYTATVSEAPAESQETRSPAPPSASEPRAKAKALREIESERSLVDSAEEKRGLAPKGYTEPPRYERRSRGPGPIQKKR